MQQTPGQNPCFTLEDPHELFQQEIGQQLQKLELDSAQQYRHIKENTDETAATALFRTPPQDLLLVKPNFASGGFGYCSVWIGTRDNKLYIRKIVLDEIDATTTKPAIEREVELTVDHPNVPQIVYHINHNGGPNPQEFGYEFKDKLVHNAWSLVSDFVNGPTLQRLTSRYVEQEERLPEWAVWKCGLTLLKILHKMQCRDIIHSDIRSRNILVSQVATIDGIPDAEFHLIDFGIAQQVHGIVGNGYRDASLVAEVLFCMMLNRPETDGYKVCQELYDEVQLARQQPDWPYSDDIVEAVWNLYTFENLESAQYGIGVPVGRMRRWLKRFNEGLTSCKTRAQESNRDETLQIEQPIIDARPLLVSANKFIQLTKGGGPACCPFRKAKINPKTLEILEVGAMEVWSEHFADVCWKSGPSSTKAEQQEENQVCCPKT